MTKFTVAPSPPESTAWPHPWTHRPGHLRSPPRDEGQPECISIDDEDGCHGNGRDNASDPKGSQHDGVEEEFDELFPSQTRTPSMSQAMNDICDEEPKDGSSPDKFPASDASNGARSRPSTGHGSGPSHVAAACPSGSKKRGLSSSGSGASTVAPKRNIRKSEGSKLASRHFDLAEDTNSLLKAMLERDAREAMEEREEVSSNKPHGTTREVMDIVKTMVADGLMKTGDPMWCFSLALPTPERREVFIQIDTNESRLAWLKWLYSTNDGQHLGACPP